mmetsp:Transcript_3126/g.8925  ORF Transcript_3126/g.8925 Transcript_3126/m.8925 type:complete len:501 (-) Transcript_3126:2556-4058(-)
MRQTSLGCTRRGRRPSHRRRQRRNRPPVSRPASPSAAPASRPHRRRPKCWSGLAALLRDGAAVEEAAAVAVVGRLVAPRLLGMRPRRGRTPRAPTGTAAPTRWCTPTTAAYMRTTRIPSDLPPRPPLRPSARVVRRGGASAPSRRCCSRSGTRTSQLPPRSSRSRRRRCRPRAVPPPAGGASPRPTSLRRRRSSRSSSRGVHLQCPTGESRLRAGAAPPTRGHRALLAAPTRVIGRRAAECGGGRRSSNTTTTNSSNTNSSNTNSSSTNSSTSSSSSSSCRRRRRSSSSSRWRRRAPPATSGRCRARRSTYTAARWRAQRRLRARCARATYVAAALLLTGSRSTVPLAARQAAPSARSLAARRSGCRGSSASMCEALHARQWLRRSGARSCSKPAGAGRAAAEREALMRHLVNETGRAAAEARSGRGPRRSARAAARSRHSPLRWRAPRLASLDDGFFHLAFEKARNWRHSIALQTFRCIRCPDALRAQLYPPLSSLFLH